MKIKLLFHCDDANGEYGLLPENAIDRDFNSFWDGRAIFHDVFEHYFEDNHKYFKGDFAFNIGGEMCAMGHLLYYYNKLGLYNRKFKKSWRDFNEAIRLTTQDMVHEAISYGYTSFGSSLESNIPRQSKNEYCDELAHYFYEDIKKVKFSGCESDIEYADYYKQSIKKSKIYNLHTYGWKMAEKLVPDNRENLNTCNDFIDIWDEITKLPAETLRYYFSGVIFTITKKNDIISWKAKFLATEGKDVIINENNYKKIFDYEYL